MANYRVKNVSPAIVSLSLRGSTGNSLILSPREVSRALTELELSSPEVQKALKVRALVQVAAN